MNIYPLNFKVVKKAGFGITPAPCDNRKWLEIPVGMSPGLYAYCPLCQQYHQVVDVNDNAKIQ